VELRIGITQAPRELEIELADDADVKAISDQIEKQLESGSGVLWLTDRRGRKVAVPAAKVAYVELGSPDEERRVGFGSGIR
jgi:hypothetical protein